MDGAAVAITTRYVKIALDSPIKYRKDLQVVGRHSCQRSKRI